MSAVGRAAILVEPNKPLVIDEVEFPDPGRGQVLVKVFSSGICHSQLHTMRRPARRGHRLPALLGHESTGVVAAKGAGVKHDHVMTTWVDRDNSTTTQPRVAHALLALLHMLAGRLKAQPHRPRPKRLILRNAIPLETQYPLFLKFVHAPDHRQLSKRNPIYCREPSASAQHCIPVFALYEAYSSD